MLKTFNAMDRRWPGTGPWYQQVAAAAASFLLISGSTNGNARKAIDPAAVAD